MSCWQQVLLVHLLAVKRHNSTSALAQIPASQPATSTSTSNSKRHDALYESSSGRALHARHPPAGTVRALMMPSLLLLLVSGSPLLSCATLARDRKRQQGLLLVVASRVLARWRGSVRRHWCHRLWPRRLEQQLNSGVRIASSAVRGVAWHRQEAHARRRALRDARCRVSRDARQLRDVQGERAHRRPLRRADHGVQWRRVRRGLRRTRCDYIELSSSVSEMSYPTLTLYDLACVCM